MATNAGARDPRAFITPDAFEVDDSLLGMPLASPSRRLAALLVDLAVIFFISSVTSGLPLLLPAAAAVLLVRAGFKRTPVKGSVFGRAMRFSVGCLGLIIGIITAIVGWGLSMERAGEFQGASIPVVNESGDVERTLSVGDVVNAGGAALAVARAETEDEATDALRRMGQALASSGQGRRGVRSALLELVPDDASWSAEAPALVDAVVSEVFADPDAVAGGEPDAVTAEVASLTTRELLLAYAAHLEDPVDGPRGEALQQRLVAEVAADSLDALSAEIEDLGAISQELRQRLTRANARLQEAEEGGLFNWLRGIVDELGFGFGWAGVYLTVLLAWWKGQTVGKKLLGIRVLQLDGEPITWWVAFERAGGYAAGFATGLLGFAQVYWDANRQAIHDRIVGTVVVREGAERVTDWEEAL